MSTIIDGIAGADLSSSRYLLVQADGSDTERIKVATAATDTENLGLLQNDPGDEEIAQVCIHGLAKGKAGGAIEPFDFVMFGTGAKLVTYVGSATNVCVGRYVPRVIDTNGTLSYNDAADGDIIDVFVNIRRID